MKCDICGTESDFKPGFITERKAFRRSTRTSCIPCRVRRRKAFEGWYQVAVNIGGLIGYILLWRDPWSTLGRFLTDLFLINLFCVLSIIPHEAGHAIVARLSGWRVFAIVVGAGKQVFRFHLFGIVFSFHWLPIAGLTQIAPIDARWFRVKRFFIYVAGVAANAAIIAIILCIWWDPWRDFGLMGLPRAARLCLWANLFTVIFNLWPRRSKISNMDTDGKQLLKIFSKKQKDVEESRAMRFVLEAALCRDELKDFKGALEWCNKGLALYPENSHLLNMAGVLSLDKQEYNRAREIFVQLLAREHSPGGQRYVFLNNVAYVDALIGDPQLLPEADNYSNEALKGIPWAAFAIGTRGTVLVEMGQLQDGAKLLKESFEKHPMPRNKALNACHLSVAYTRMGDRDQADKYLKLARQLDSQCSLIERAEAELKIGKEASRQPQSQA